MRVDEQYFGMLLMVMIVLLSRNIIGKVVNSEWSDMREKGKLFQSYHELFVIKDILIVSLSE